MNARRYVHGAKRRLFRHLARDTSAWDTPALIQAFHRLYYDAHVTWTQTFWRGYRVSSVPSISGHTQETMRSRPSSSEPVMQNT